MTIARDAISGEVVGQLTDRAPVAIGKTWLLVLLGRNGRYVTVPRSSVRLEVVR